jgi:hypothetical protein
MAEVAKLEKKPEPKVDAEWCSIHKALPQITGAIDPIEKGKKNPQQGYMFRGVDDVYAALNLLLEKFGVTILPEVLESSHDSFTTKNGAMMFRHRAKVKYTLVASDSTSLACTVEGEGMDSGDKSTQKALSMAYKYMAFQVFCIPTGEKIDTEEDSPEVVGPAQAAPAKEKPKAVPAPKQETPTPALEGAAAQAANSEGEDPDSLAKRMIDRIGAGFENEHHWQNFWKTNVADINALPQDLKKQVRAAYINAGPKS